MFDIHPSHYFLSFNQTAISKQKSLMGASLVHSFQCLNLKNTGNHSICGPDTDSIADLERWEQRSTGSNFLVTKRLRNALKVS
jgi:hypothetical protein